MNTSPKVSGKADEKSSKANGKKKIAAVLLLLAGSLTVFSANTLTDYAVGISAPDGIYIPDATHRFSKDEANAGVYSHTFRIYNLRPRILQVEAQPDCGCTGVSWNKTTIIPYGWKDVTAQMEANKSKSGNSVAIGFQSDSLAQPWIFAFLKS